MQVKPVSEESAIQIRGARVHNLKNIDLDILRDRFIAITGLSGSGKSSLAFDTLYAEGQRRYVESLSAYARQFLGRMQKPEVDFISGIPPAIAIGQKVNTRNPRSTVGTSTEIYDYLRLLFARIGRTISPVSGKQVMRHSVSDVVDHLLELKNGTQVLIMCPCERRKDCTLRENMEILVRQGITRIESRGEIYRIDELLDDPSQKEIGDPVHIVVDRTQLACDEDSLARIADSVQTAYNIGKGRCTIRSFETEKGKTEHFSNRFESDGMLFEEPTEHMFSFNNPVGACPLCEGYGKILGIDEDLVIPNKGLSVYNDAVVCWKGEKMSRWKQKLVMNASELDFPVHKPYYQLSDEQKDILWNGRGRVKGIHAFFRYLEEKKYKIQYRVMLSRYRGKTTCPECKGNRLKKESSYVQVGGRTIQQMINLPLDQLRECFREPGISNHEGQVAGRLLAEIRSRLDFLVQVGLPYLTLNRLSSSLSGGESQRINLATALGSSLVGSLYILDEPSIGLHPRDTGLLIGVLKDLNEIGNTVIVVEHDEEIIRAASEVIDMGPGAGRLGGEVVFQGSRDEMVKNGASLTGKYLSGERRIPTPKLRRKWNSFIEFTGARENNLKNIDVRIPLHTLTVITGVSGSGKSSLVKNIVYPALSKRYHGHGEKTGEYDQLRGDLESLQAVEFVDQNPIGKSSRSNPVTYIKAYDEIRKLFAGQPASRLNQFKPSHFSFNVEGGRCEECQGEGTIRVEMQFMADVELICESCQGKRFRDEVLEVRYQKRNIADILDLTVDEAIEFFSGQNDSTAKKVAEKLTTLSEVGLGYIKLGQSSSTLSGGESQRVKLASFLGREKEGSHCLFIFDEPTTGLHFHDINKLLDAFQSLIEKGNSILIIEHNLEVIKTADWIIDLGPEGGMQGGNLVFTGTPEEIARCRESHTGRYLSGKL